MLAVGNPFGVGQTVTSGIVSAVARTNLGINDSGFFIQTDAAINPGNSGGALVDIDGALVGINTAIFSRSGGSIGIGFAIPSDMVRTVVAQAVAGSTAVARAWIGVVCQDVTPDIAASLGVASPRGALVAHVDENSPGGKAGLKVGDLIVKAGDRDVGDAAAFDYRLAVAGIGNPVALQVWRDGVTLPLSVVAGGGAASSNEADLTLIGGRSPLTGAVVADLSASLADRMQHPRRRDRRRHRRRRADVAGRPRRLPARRRAAQRAGRGRGERQAARRAGGGRRPRLADQLQPRRPGLQHRDRGMSNLFEAAGLADVGPASARRPAPARHGFPRSPGRTICSARRAR